ncbi:MAG: oxygen-insensitive NAD(P)H-dependent nitroreductase NfsB [Thiomicrorhabdus chilensis]|uniref:oxygen-insensitive NAD(P)H-dependent nitroreductase NfsB n=1 Tax=Thiomicrorhabdus chilensis TaxID=63656 RepID=UPI000424E208|nr:oxygen-insensitive NAD(P)H-dependent nitroreductase NfsB [Thiomicrorhabdus chilensis]MDX1348119.1 oxygen-insensitive NAD(P)H-dependent nitroreductase NfsB [Thiomicrorhabdus chilensis]
MNLIEVAKKRYATKKFDSGRSIPQEVFKQIKGLLQLSPSSVNSQPWHFIIADSEAGKKRLSRGTQGVYSANEAKVLDASHVILFCAKTDMDDDYLQHLLENEDKDGRFPKPESKEMVKKVRGFYADLHRKELQDTQCWMEKQVYLNMGTILLAAGVLGVDAVPIEGVDVKVLNEEFDLIRQGYTAVAMIALGYRDEGDFNADLPKSRLPQAELFTFLK